MGLVLRSSPAVSIPAAANGLPPVRLISSDMPLGTSSPVETTYMPGAPVSPAHCTIIRPREYELQPQQAFERAKNEPEAGNADVQS
jgi:hypothetical protein